MDVCRSSARVRMLVEIAVQDPLAQDEASMLFRRSLCVGAALGAAASSACGSSSNGLFDPSPDAPRDAAPPQTDATAKSDAGDPDDASLPGDEASLDASPIDATTSADASP